MSLAILSLSILLQFTAAGLALRLIMLTGRKRAWSLIATAMVLMGIGRCITLYRVVSGDLSLPPDLSAELVALAISLLLFAGVALIGPLFADSQKTHEALKESEARLRVFIDNVPSLVSLKDLTGKYLLVNKEYDIQFGFDPEKTEGKSTQNLFPPEVAEKFAQQEREVVETKSQITLEQEIPHPGGSRVHLCTKFPIMDSFGAVKAVGTISTDITEQRQTEMLMTRLGRIVEQSLNEIYAFDAKTFRFTQVNLGARDNLGYTMEELLELTPMDLKPAYTRKQFEDLIQPLRDGTQDKIVFETVHKRKDGSLYDVEVHLQLMAAEFPAVFVAIINDINDRKIAEEDRRQALIKAEEANQAKSEFLATISHELRTPLNAILGFTDILSNQYLGPLGDKKYIEYANDIHASGEHLLDLVNDLLDISAIETGNQSLNMEELSIEELVKDCSRIMKEQAHNKNIRFLTEIPGGLPPICGDRRAIKQIVLNLLSNAVKFTPEGQKVTISVRAGNGETSINVADTGIGIDEARLPGLTDPFVRAGQDPYLSKEGTGLGLAITKSLVELHDGSLEITSTPGKGTTVTVTFPNA